MNVIGCSHQHTTIENDRVYMFELFCHPSIKKPLTHRLTDLFNMLNQALGSQSFILSNDHNNIANSKFVVKPFSNLKLNDKNIVGLGANTSSSYTYIKNYLFHQQSITLLNYGMNIAIDYDFAKTVFADIQSSSSFLTLYQSNIFSHQLDHSINSNYSLILFDRLVLHEIGHGLGFQHSTDKSSIMYDKIFPNTTGIDNYIVRVKSTFQN